MKGRMLSHERVLATCREKWNKEKSETAIRMETGTYTMYLTIMRNRLFNVDDPNKNGEYTLYSTLRPLLRVVVDVGAREDTYLIENSETETHLHVFEPHPEFYKSLKKNIEEKKLDEKYKNLYMYNEGVSDKEMKLPYYERAQSFVNRWNEEVSKELPVVRLDSIERLQKEEEISYLKIDTEGYEIDVLRGAEGLLWKTKLIQFEYGGTYKDRGVKLKDVVRYLQSHGFNHYYYIYNDGVFIMESEEVMEHDQYSNILASKFSL